MTIELYIVEYAGGEAGPWQQSEIEEARAFAREHRGALIARIFEFSDSELIEDHREEGGQA